jgi:gluconolactonase
VGNAPATVRPSARTVGLCFDKANGGSMVVTETSPSAIARRKPDGTMREAIAGTFNALALNAPNDCVVVANKGIYVTDPDYLGMTQPKERVYRVTGTPAVVTSVAEYDRGKHPNGIAATADGSTLYIGLTGEAEIVKVALGADGTPMGAPVAFAKTGPAPDGIAVDTEGNVFVATQAGVEAYSPAGQKWGTVVLPGTQKATSIEFGGADNKTLYVASLANGLGGAGSPAIHKLELRVAGVN